MAFRLATRRFPTTALPRAAIPRASSFHNSTRALIRVGDPIPDLPVLVEDSPGNKVSIASELAVVETGRKSVIVGVPAAFSPACSASHVPSYMNHPKLGEVGKVFVVSVNDAFVMKAWGDQLDPAKETGIRFLGDPTCEFTKALELDFDAAAIFGGPRSKRYALVVKDGKVESVHVEPDNTGTSVSMAKDVLG
jgi:2-Cys peroxiredoxin 5